MTTDLYTISEPSCICHTKQSWAGDWVEETLLECLSIVDQAAPGHSSAQFRYRYGRALLPPIGSFLGDRVATDKPRPDLKGWYVRVTVTGLGYWWGIITDVDDSPDGLLYDPPNAPVPTGTQTLTAFGLTWLLDQAKPIRQSVIKVAGGTAIINRALPFNGGTDGGRKRKAHVAWKNYDLADECFTSQEETAEPLAWSAINAVEYVLAEFPPLDSTDSVLIAFELAAGAASYLDYELPQIEYHGMTPWRLLNTLIDRRRGLVWWATIESDVVKINIASQNAEDVELSDSTVDANPNTMAYNFETASNIKASNIGTTLQVYYDQIITEGERTGSVFTVRPETNFEPDWTSAEETVYNDGATAQTGFSSLSDADKYAANMDARANDKLDPVFSWWRLRPDWNGRSDTDPTSGSAPYAFPLLSENSEVTLAESNDYYVAGLRIENYVPMRAGANYTGAITPETAQDDERDADFIPPLALFKAQIVNSGDATDAGWVYAERLNQGIEGDSEKRPYKYSIDVSVRDDAPGLIFRTSGAPQHFIAEELFVPDSSYEAIPTGEGIESESWLATVYMLGDDFAQGCWPLSSALPTLDLVRQLVLKVPNTFLDYIVPGTIVGAKAGALLKTTAGGWLRDDRTRLRDIAKLAHTWYGTERRTLNLAFRGIVSGFDIGTLITTIGSDSTLETINTVITSVTYDLKSGTTSLNTQFGEMDFTI